MRSLIFFSIAVILFTDVTTASPTNAKDTVCPSDLETTLGCQPCIKTCQDLGMICAMVCVPSDECHCKPGYVRDEDGTCIDQNLCPAVVEA